MFGGNGFRGPFPPNRWQATHLSIFACRPASGQLRGQRTDFEQCLSVDRRGRCGVLGRRGRNLVETELADQGHLAADVVVADDGLRDRRIIVERSARGDDLFLAVHPPIADIRVESLEVGDRGQHGGMAVEVDDLAVGAVLRVGAVHHESHRIRLVAVGVHAHEGDAVDRTLGVDHLGRRSVRTRRQDRSKGEGAGEGIELHKVDLLMMGWFVSHRSETKCPDSE